MATKEKTPATSTKAPKESKGPKTPPKGSAKKMAKGNC